MRRTMDALSLSCPSPAIFRRPPSSQEPSSKDCRCLSPGVDNSGRSASGVTDDVSSTFCRCGRKVVGARRRIVGLERRRPAAVWPHILDAASQTPHTAHSRTTQCRRVRQRRRALLSEAALINRPLTGAQAEYISRPLPADVRNAPFFCGMPERFPWVGIVMATGRHPPPPRVAGPAEAQLTVKTLVAPHLHGRSRNFRP
jgi:hypothetical protein